MRGFQLRYVSLVAGSLLILLLFAGAHGIFMVQSALPQDVFAQFTPTLQASTVRLFLVGLLYVTVVTLAAVFLSHRLVGPARRLEEEIRKIADNEETTHSLKIREGDEFEGLVHAINLLVQKASKAERK